MEKISITWNCLTLKRVERLNGKYYKSIKFDNTELLISDKSNFDIIQAKRELNGAIKIKTNLIIN